MLIFEVICDKFILVEICTTGNYLRIWDLGAKLHESEKLAVNEGLSLVLWNFNHRKRIFGNILETALSPLRCRIKPDINNPLSDIIS
jgi:hypothetical protein